MTSETDIVNLGIYKIKGTPIDTIGEDGIEGEPAEVIYPIIRDAVLADHPWNFAMTRAELAASATAPDFEFSYKYPLPADCLRVWDVYNASTNWRVEGRFLLTDASECSIVYIRQVTETGYFSPLFVLALGTRIGSELAIPVAGDKELKNALFQEYLMLIRRAKTADGQEGTVDSISATMFTDARGGSNPSIITFSLPS